MILEAQHICKSYRNGVKELPVLTDVSLSVDHGSVHTIMGPSGAGKTTLLNILGTIDDFDSGDVIIQGQSVKHLSDDELAIIRNQQLGFVFQFHHLLPEFTAYENVLIPSMIQDNADGKQLKAKEMFEYVGLTERMEHYPSELSGGERLRVAVLRALINEPSLVLADEPTGNLDVENSRRLLDLFIRISKDFNQAFIITTHNPDIAKIGHHQWKLNQGTLQALDSI